MIEPSLIKPVATTAPEPVEVTEVSAKRKPTAAQLGPKEYCWGMGRRKSSVARVRLRPGEGKIMVNNREMANYFPKLDNQNQVNGPLHVINRTTAYDVFVNVRGGGSTGQAGAVVLGLARALVTAEPDCFQPLRTGGYLTRDSRMKERKKYGQKGARKRCQFSKR